MRAHRTALFFRIWQRLPHGPFNRAAAALMHARLPRPLLDRLIEAWIRRAGIRVADFEPGPFDSLQDFFLRRLRPGARPLEAGFISPADGRVMAVGQVESGQLMQVKGSPYSLAALCSGGDPAFDEARWQGGRYATVFLSPDGYHHLHHPIDGDLVAVRWLPGRHLPQNEDAVHHIEAIYARNERVVLTVRAADGSHVLLVLVAASLVGGIHLEAMSQAEFMHPQPQQMSQPLAVRRGDRLGHFAFGSTVVVVTEPGSVGPSSLALGDSVHMGQRLFS